MALLNKRYRGQLRLFGLDLLASRKATPLKQNILGAQVTNPPIDPLREGLVMSLNTRLGKRGNLLHAAEDAYSQVHTPAPVLDSLAVCVAVCMLLSVLIRCST